MLIIFGLVTYATKGVSLEQLIQGNSEYLYSKGRKIPNDYFMGNHRSSCCMVHLEQDNIWKEPLCSRWKPVEASTVSGISVFKVTMGAFIMAGILYGFGSWLGVSPNGWIW